VRHPNVLPGIHQFLAEFDGGNCTKPSQYIFRTVWISYYFRFIVYLLGMMNLPLGAQFDPQVRLHNHRLAQLGASINARQILMGATIRFYY
jgi:hypothetical protein